MTKYVKSSWKKNTFHFFVSRDRKGSHEHTLEIETIKKIQSKAIHHPYILMSKADYYESRKQKRTIINLLALPGGITYIFRDSADEIVMSIPTRLMPALEHYQNLN